MNKILFIILTMMFMFAFTCPAIAQTNPQSGPEAGHKREASAGLKIVDVVLVRPISVVGSTISTAAYLVISPFVFVMGVAAQHQTKQDWPEIKIETSRIKTHSAAHQIAISEKSKDSYGKTI